jgi:ribosomal protein S18 acetylase RimI-like enzyme
MNTSEHRLDVRRLLPSDAEQAFQAIRSLKHSMSNLIIDIKYVEKLLHNPSNVFIAALDENQPIGYLLAYLLDRFDHEQQMLCVYEIEVVEHRRGNGIGRSMIEALQEFCQEADLHKAWTITDQSNTAAIRLFQSSGARAEQQGVDTIFVWRPEAWRSACKNAR